MYLFSNRPQIMLKWGKNKKVAHQPLGECVIASHMKSINFVYSTLNKITKFWLIASSTINPKLYSVGVPLKFPWKWCVRKKMADIRFTILMGLFLPNKELFTNFLKFNHAWKHEEDRWNYFQCYTKPNLWVATILA